MSDEYLIQIVTIFVTLVLGFVSKKYTKIKDDLIPLQNIFIGLIIAIIKWIITKDFSMAIALSGILAGGIYDIPNNLKKLKKGNENETK